MYKPAHMRQLVLIASFAVKDCCWAHGILLKIKGLPEKSKYGMVSDVNSTMTYFRSQPTTDSPILTLYFAGWILVASIHFPS
jgi:hypothetical protein